MKHRLAAWLGIVAYGGLGCGGSQPAAPASIPTGVSSVAGPNPHNALSAAVVFRSQQADSARVVALAENLPADSTPFVKVTGSTDTIVAVNLRPAVRYRLVLKVAGQGGIVRTDTLSYTTGSLPDLLKRVSISTIGSTSGLTLTSLQVGGNSVFALAFDSSGAIRWYREFEGKEPVSADFKQQPSGNFTLYRGTSYGSQKVPGHFIEFTPAGDSGRAITVPLPRYMDNHELLITTGPDGGERLHFFTYDHRTTDLAPAGVPTTTSLAGHQLVRTRSDGTVEFEWNAWDHVGVDEWIEPPKPDPANPGEPDYDHPNSLAFDHDGNYLVSFRHLGQVMKINSRSGAIMWRLGGVKNQFRILDDPFGGFSAQHSARTLPNGNLILFDNGTRHPSPESRAVEYALDTKAWTARLVRQFRHVPPIYTPYVGLVQHLENDNTLVSFAQEGRASEVDRGGRVRWEAAVRVDGKPAFLYRLVRIASLYQYLAP
jgi:hypothetical protein